MFTINHEFVPGAELPGKGRLLLTDSISFKFPIFAHPILLFRNPNISGSPEASQDFMPVDFLQKSFERLMQDYYAPFTGWFEIDETDLYVYWDNYERDVYSPKSPISFETATIDTSYEEFYKMVQRNDPCLGNSNFPSHIPLPAKGTPLMYIKFTYLGSDNQALAISLTTSHILSDGFSYNNICNNWAAIYRRMVSNSSMPSSLNQVEYPVPNPPSFGSVDLSKYRICEKEGNEQKTEEKTTDDVSIQQKAVNPTTLVDICLKISLDKQAELREKAHNEGISFNMYLFGNLWKELTKVYLHYNPEIINNTTSFGVAVDTRSILDIPVEVCTDASIILRFDEAVKVIVETDAVDVAKTIKSKLKMLMTPESICKAVDGYTSIWKQACHKEGDTSVNFSQMYFDAIKGTPRLRASSWLNIKPLEVDFGSGIPVCLRPPKVDVNGMIFVSPPGPEAADGSISVVITIPDNYNISASSVLSEFAIEELTYHRVS